MSDEVIILEPPGKKSFDAAAWLAELDRYRAIPTIEDGRDQDTILDADTPEYPSC